MFRAFTRGVIVSGKEHDRVVKEKDEAMAAKTAIEETVRKDVLPVMTRFVDINNDRAGRRAT